MNDTETEARRLLAAATEDMPPGIGLLDGFAEARRRDRARRTRRRVVLSAGIAVAAASVTAVTLTIGSAPPALATVTRALTVTLTQSYHLTEQGSVYYIENGRITSRSHTSFTTEADPVHHLYATSGSGFQEREVGGYTYRYFRDPADHPGKHWERTADTGPPRETPVTILGSFTTDTPQQMLADIEKADKVTVAGPASGPGWTGTRYAFSGSKAEISESSGTVGAIIELSGTVTVDQQGRARALVLTIRITNPVRVLGLTYDLTFSDFGAPVTVTPPPADQTFP